MSRKLVVSDSVQRTLARIVSGLAAMPIPPYLASTAVRSERVPPPPYRWLGEVRPAGSAPRGSVPGAPLHQLVDVDQAVDLLGLVVVVIAGGAVTGAA